MTASLDPNMKSANVFASSDLPTPVGRLTDSNGRTVDFKNTIVIMTSNVGSKFIGTDTSFGFLDPSRVEETKFDSMKTKLQEEIRKEFKPEFLNRIDDIIVFKPLNKEIIRAIVDIMLGDVQVRLKEKDIKVTFTDEVKDFLVERGFDPKMGARPLRRSIQEHFEDPLADKLLKENMRSHISVKATVKNEKVHFTVRKLKPKTKASKALPKENKELITSG
jgi:ATP-dependent Clp protease ATP-binding subunit ClpC